MYHGRNFGAQTRVYCEVDVSIILFVCHVAPPFVIGVHHTPPLIMRYLYCEVDK